MWDKTCPYGIWNIICFDYYIQNYHKCVKPCLEMFRTNPIIMEIYWGFVWDMKPQMGIWFMAIHSMMKGMLVLGI